MHMMLCRRSLHDSASHGVSGGYEFDVFCLVH